MQVALLRWEVECQVVWAAWVRVFRNLNASLVYYFVIFGPLCVIMCAGGAPSMGGMSGGGGMMGMGIFDD